LAERSDKELVEAVLDGERAAYGRLYDRYAPLVRAVCHDAAGNLTDAQDLAQDVFLRAYERLDRLRERGLFGRWLVGIARRRCREWVRGRSRRQKAYAGLNGRAGGQVASDDHSGEQVRRMIGGLGEKERLVLHAFYLRGEPAEEVRRSLGLSRSGFYRRLDRARKQLERLLAREPEDMQ
jgi:RNA polymerase sigma-70 factor (ECF subfamily)